MGEGISESIAYAFCDACSHVPYCGIKAYLKNSQIVKIDSWETYPNRPLCLKDSQLCRGNIIRKGLVIR